MIEVYRKYKFLVSKFDNNHQDVGGKYYISIVSTLDGCYLHKTLKIHSTTGYLSIIDNITHGGIYDTLDEAKETIEKYIQEYPEELI